MEENKVALPEYENKLKGRFSIKFPDEFGIPPEAVYFINKPHIKNFIDHIWEDVEIHLLDYVKPAIAQKLFEIVSRKSDTEFTYSHHIMDKKDDLVESWKVYVEKIMEINFGESSFYDLNCSNIIFLKLRISNCELVL